MVTPTETPVEARDDSPAEAASPPVVEDSSGDEPLIPVGTPTEDLAVPPGEPEAPEAEQPEAVDSAPAEAEASEEAKPEAEETPESRSFSQDEWSKREATIQRERTETLRVAEEVTTAANQVREQFGQQETSRQIAAMAQGVLTKLTEDGVQNPEVIANDYATAVQGWGEADRQNKLLRTEVERLATQNVDVATQAVVLKVTTEMGLTDPLDRAKVMRGATNEGDVRENAQALLDQRELAALKTTAKQAEVPAASPETAMDAGGGDATETDASFEARVSEMAWPLPGADQKRLSEIQAARR